MCLLDASVGVPIFVRFKIPTGVCSFRFLVFKIPDFIPSFAAFTGDSFGLGPNFVFAKIVHLKLRTLFAASHTLVAGYTIKVAL